MCRLIVWRAVRGGLITACSCLVCGGNDAIYHSKRGKERVIRKGLGLDVTLGDPQGLWSLLYLLLALLYPILKLDIQT